MKIICKGHPNITATHPTTLAVTRDPEVTRRGDCFICVGAEYELTPSFLARLRTAKCVRITIKASGKTEVIIAQGHPSLNPSGKELVVRKSDYIDSRTLVIRADKACKDLNTVFKEQLKKATNIEITVEPEKA